MRIIVEPQAMNWSNARSFASFKGGRLPSPAEIQHISKSKSLTVDVWTSEENEDLPETAKFWSRHHQTIRTKDKRKLCLLVYLL